jgi:hypothetical protein
MESEGFSTKRGTARADNAGRSSRKKASAFEIARGKNSEFRKKSARHAVYARMVQVQVQVQVERMGAPRLADALMRCNWEETHTR